jgi:4-carboxymuconolactone decarboxylase
MTMDGLTAREGELTAIGAAIASNCMPGIERHVLLARRAGISNSQILEAVRLAEKVRQVPARQVLEGAWTLLDKGAGTRTSSDECGSPAPAGDQPATDCC